MGIISSDHGILSAGGIGAQMGFQALSSSLNLEGLSRDKHTHLEAWWVTGQQQLPGLRRSRHDRLSPWRFPRKNIAIVEAAGMRVWDGTQLWVTPV